LFNKWYHSQQPLQDFLNFKYYLCRISNEYVKTEEVANLRSNKFINKISNFKNTRRKKWHVRSPAVKGAETSSLKPPLNPFHFILFRRLTIYFIVPSLIIAPLTNIRIHPRRCHNLFLSSYSSHRPSSPKTCHRCSSLYFASRYNVELPSQLIVSHRTAIVVYPCILRRATPSNCHRSAPP
jgi:hypothetical protein